MTKIQAGESTALLRRWHTVKVKLNIFPFYSLQRGTTGGNEDFNRLQQHGREASLGDKVNKTYQSDGIQFKESYNILISF